MKSFFVSASVILAICIAPNLSYGSEDSMECNETGLGMMVGILKGAKIITSKMTLPIKQASEETVLGESDTARCRRMRRVYLKTIASSTQVRRWFRCLEASISMSAIDSAYNYILENSKLSEKVQNAIRERYAAMLIEQMVGTASPKLTGGEQILSSPAGILAAAGVQNAEKLLAKYTSQFRSIAQKQFQQLKLASMPGNPRQLAVNLTRQIRSGTQIYQLYSKSKDAGYCDCVASTDTVAGLAVCSELGVATFD